MPIFEYACRRCGAELATLVRSTDPEPTRCQACDSPQLRRVVSRFNVGGSRAADSNVLTARPRDFLERPERFGEAMRTMSARTGIKLGVEAVDDAMHRLARAKRGT